MAIPMKHILLHVVDAKIIIVRSVVFPSESTFRTQLLSRMFLSEAKAADDEANGIAFDPVIGMYALADCLVCL